MPDTELEELTRLYEERGLSHDLAVQVAMQLTARNALEAHARDELGMSELTRPKPLQAAMASGASFISGGVLPLVVALFFPIKYMVVGQYAFSLVFLGFSGAVAARFGGADVTRGVIRICFWGTVAMGVSAVVGYLFGVRTA